jgi:hypothetical protein
VVVFISLRALVTSASLSERVDYVGRFHDGYHVWQVVHRASASGGLNRRRRRRSRRATAGAPVDVAEGGMDVGRQIEARGNPVEELEPLRAFVCDERPR